MKSKDPLAPYKEKRNFTTTPEPAGSQSSENTSLRFVIQKHDARSTHYDLRLELDGVLKSWAVPKGPSLEPGQKRLAVNVEDHPLEYLDFEGTIPPKQYGAGDMIIWDRGTWEPIADPARGYNKGHLKFHLHGQKLQGTWALVQMHPKSGEKKDWLLIKERDAQVQASSDAGSQPHPPDNLPDELFMSLPSGAIPGPVPPQLAPQLATLVDQPPSGDEWIYEIKFDGYRIMARYDNDSVTLHTRNGLDWTAKLASLVPALKELKIAPGWLDGEIVILGDKGIPDFGALQSAFESGRTDEIVYFVFDLPYYAGYDLREASLTSRRILLARVLKDTTTSRVRFSDSFAGGSADIFRSACDLGLEGIMGKQKDAAYTSGRSRSWIKLKCTQRQEFVVVGYTPPTRSGPGFRSLLLGVYDQNGKLQYAGKVGTGFNARNRGAIQAQLERLAADQSPLAEVLPGEKQARWVKPELVAEVSFTEWTKEAKVRHGAFQGLRTDKDPRLVTREGTAATTPSAPPPTARPSRNRPTGSTSTQKISNPDRVVDPSTGARKIDIVDYYTAAARWILPYLSDRPVSVVRAPEGIEGELFFQKHGGKLKIPGLRQLDPALDPGHPALMAIDSLEALIGAVQMNVIEFHTWNAAVGNIEKPDRMIFDLDPGEGTSWAMMVEAARLTRTLLEELQLVSFLKISGGKGLHIVVPLKPRDDWETVKAFAKGVAAHLARVIPTYFTDIAGPRNRVGKIYIDFNRNTRGATTVEAFSVRARAGLGISMPCSWDELPLLTGGDHWKIANVGPRLEGEDDPWQDYDKSRQILRATAKKLILKT